MQRALGSSPFDCRRAVLSRRRHPFDASLSSPHSVVLRGNGPSGSKPSNCGAKAFESVEGHLMAKHCRLQLIRENHIAQQSLPSIQAVSGGRISSGSAFTSLECVWFGV